jgi:4'-phosphopantetheinyl transferase
MLEVWSIDLGACRAGLLQAEEATPRLPEHMHFPAAGDERRLAHIALRILLERVAGAGVRRIGYEVSPSGKPSLPGSALAFNLSHAAGHALVALASPGPAGVDIEAADRRLGPLLARRGRIEAMAVVLAGGRALTATSATLQAWVRLEAFAKADGRGIGLLLTRLGIMGHAIGDNEAERRATDLLRQEVAVAIDDLEVAPGFIGALARRRDLPPPLIRAFPTTASEIAALTT